MSLSDLTSPTAVKHAIQECDSIGREEFLRKYGFAPAREYVLYYEEKEYDSKAVAGVAYGFQYPQAGPLASAEFSGGIAPGGAAAQLFELGFEIKGKKHKVTDWSLMECEQTVAAYFQCLQHKIRQEAFNREAACR